MDFKTYVQSIVASYVAKDNKNIIFIKHYNTLDITEHEILAKVDRTDEKVFLYHEFAMHYMHESYAPFLQWIRQCYNSYYKDVMTVEEVDNITRRVQRKVYAETGVILTGVGVYSFNTKNEEAARIHNTVMETVLKHDWALQVHAFHADTVKKKMRFDVVFSFDIESKEGYEIIMKEMRQLYPDYSITITSDVDVS